MTARESDTERCMATAAPQTYTRRMKRTGYGKLWLALLLLGVVAVATYRTTTTLAENTRWVSHTHEVIESLGGIVTGIAEAESARRGFALTGDPEALVPYSAALQRLSTGGREVRALTLDDPAQRRRSGSAGAVAPR